MKPAAIVLVLSLGVFAGGAAAQTPAPWQFAETSAGPPPQAVGDHFGPCPTPWNPRLPAEAPDAFLWSDYRGSYIEHDLYRPRYLASSGEPQHGRPILSALGVWLDSLFDWLPGRRKHACQNCGPAVAAHGVVETPFVPSSPESYLPLPEAPRLVPVPSPEQEPTPPASQPRPVQPAPVSPNPAPPAPVQVVPVQPAPSNQSDRPPTNEIPPRRPPTNEIPPRLIPPRTPVVELAPEPAIPAERTPTPAPTIPRNRVPRPGQQLPRNGVPR